ncbi:MAG: tetratricopeptide repeat protein [Neisseriaceae bacterium]
MKLEQQIINSEIVSSDIFLSDFNQLSGNTQKQIVEQCHYIKNQNKSIAALIYLCFVYSRVENFKNISYAIKLCEEIMSLDDTNIEIMYYLGTLNLIEYNLNKALYWYEKAAEKGNVDAMLNLGYLYENEWVIKDDFQALAWFKQTADAGHLCAIEHLKEKSSVLMSSIDEFIINSV